MVIPHCGGDIQVTVSCGEQDEVTSVAEPGQCEYALTLRTPAACLEADIPRHRYSLGAGGGEAANATTGTSAAAADEVGGGAGGEGGAVL